MEHTEVRTFADRWIGKAFEEGCRTREDFRKAAVEYSRKGNSLLLLMDALVRRGILDAEEERQRGESSAERIAKERAAGAAERERLETIARNIVMRDGVAVLAGAQLSG